MRNRHCLIVIFAGLLVFPAITDARRIEPWPYSRLLKASDLVVFAAPVRTEPTDDQLPDDRWPYALVGQNTTFKIDHTLKGEVEEGKEIKVLHFKFGDLKKAAKDDVIINGPLHVSFPVGEAARKRNQKRGERLSSDQYLLFLKKTEDGRFVPVSGQTDPVLAIREISEPLPLLTVGE